MNYRKFRIPYCGDSLPCIGLCLGAIWVLEDDNNHNLICKLGIVEPRGLCRIYSVPFFVCTNLQKPLVLTTLSQIFHESIFR